MARHKPRLVFNLHPRVFGGTESFLLRLAVALRKDFAPVFISPRLGPALSRAASFGFETALVREGRGSARKLLQIAPSLLQSNYYLPFMAMAGKELGVPHVWRVGGHPDLVLAHLSAPDREAFLKMMSLLSDKIICASRFIARPFAAAGLEDAAVINNGVSLPSRALPAFREGNPFKIAMVAHLHPQKRHEDFIRAAGELLRGPRMYEFVIFGNALADQRTYAAGLKKMARELGAGGKIKIRAFSGDASAALADCHAFALPAENEGASNAILEAMALGLPAVVARSGGNAELVAHRKTGLIIPAREPRALVAAIEVLASNPGLRLRIGQAAREAAKRSFSIEASAARYARLYASLL